MLKDFFSMQKFYLRKAVKIPLCIFAFVVIAGVVLTTLNNVSSNSDYAKVIFAQLTCIIAFIYSSYIVLLEKYWSLSEFYPDYAQSSKFKADPEGFKALEKWYNSKPVLMSVSAIFLRIVFYSLLTMLLLYTICASIGIMSFDLVFIAKFTAFYLATILFWFFYNMTFRLFLKQKFIVIFTQISTLVMLLGGGFIFPFTTFTPSIDTMTQILPARAIGDLSIYITLGAKTPGGAIVSLLEFTLLFACLFSLSLGYAKRNKIQMFINSKENSN